MYQHILIATDGSELADRAVQHGVSLAKALGAKVSFLVVTEPFHTFSFAAQQLEDTRPEYERHMKEHATRILSAAGEVAEAAGVSYDKLQREGNQPFENIIKVAEASRCDLIVMASHGRHGMSALVLGSVTMRVLAQGSTPVLVVR